jgi:hypothetical protein
MGIFDMFHYLIGMIIVAFLIWSIIKLNNYFSKNNVPITNQTLTEKFIGKPLSSAVTGQPQTQPAPKKN